jgi:hypothetical protein
MTLSPEISVFHTYVPLARVSAGRSGRVAINPHPGHGSKLWRTKYVFHTHVQLARVTRAGG